MIKKLKKFLESAQDNLPYKLLSEFEQVKWIKMLKKAFFSIKEIEEIKKLIDVEVLESNIENEYNYLKLKTGYIFSYNHDYYILTIGKNNTKHFLCKGLNNLLETIKLKLYNKQTVLKPKQLK